MKAKDGWVSPGLEIGVQEDIWSKVCELMGVPDLADDPAFNSREARREHQQDLLTIVGEWAATRTKEEVYHALQGMRTISGYVATVEDLFKSEQFFVSRVLPAYRPSLRRRGDVSRRAHQHRR